MSDRDTIDLEKLTAWLYAGLVTVEDARSVDTPGEWLVVLTYSLRHAVEQLRVRFQRKADRDTWFIGLKSHFRTEEAGS